MLEGLIAMVLLSVIGLGITYALAKSTAAQRLTNAQNLLIGQVRANIQSSGIADGCPTSSSGAPTSNTRSLPLTSGTSESVTKSCTIAAVTLTPAGGTAETVKLPLVTFTSSSGGSSNFDTAITLGN